MYFNQTDIVHLKSLTVLVSLFILTFFTDSLCWADEVKTAPVQVMLSQHYNAVIKVNLPTIIIKTTSLVEHGSLSIKDVIVNDGKCRTTSKRRRLLPKQLQLGQSLEIGLMLGCHVKKIVVRAEIKNENKSWQFTISTNYSDEESTKNTGTAIINNSYIGEI
jgi:hypothetical protein